MFPLAPPPSDSGWCKVVNMHSGIRGLHEEDHGPNTVVSSIPVKPWFAWQICGTSSSLGNDLGKNSIIHACTITLIFRYSWGDENLFSAQILVQSNPGGKSHQMLAERL